MSVRFTPLEVRQLGGLKGFGFSVFIDNTPETASQSVHPHEGVVSAYAGTASDENPAPLSPTTSTHISARKAG